MSCGVLLTSSGHASTILVRDWSKACWQAPGDLASKAALLLQRRKSWSAATATQNQVGTGVGQESRAIAAAFPKARASQPCVSTMGVMTGSTYVTVEEGRACAGASRMRWMDLLGYAASAAVLATFCMSTMIPLRILALVSNILFMAYGYVDNLV